MLGFFGLNFSTKSPPASVDINFARKIIFKSSPDMSSPVPPAVTLVIFSVHIWVSFGTDKGNEIMHEWYELLHIVCSDIKIKFYVKSRTVFISGCHT